MNKNEILDRATLADWLQSSVNPEDTPIWTDEHIDELMKDFDIRFKKEENMEEDETIMDIDVNNLSQKQYKFLKKHSISILESIIKDLEQDNLQGVQNKMLFSPAGDGWGENNYFINFAYKKNERVDLNMILQKMANIKGIQLNDND